MKTYVILLRGVTPRGRNRVPMAELRAVLGNAGLADVRTYIQSGNVIAGTELDRAVVESLGRDVVRREIGADLTVLARPPRQIGLVLERNPFPADAAARTYFSLLAAKPTPSLTTELTRSDFAPDEVRVVGQTVYTLYAMRHSDSRIDNNFFERRLGVAATTRNFNTLSRLLALSA